MSFKKGDRVIWLTAPEGQMVGVLTDGPYTVTPTHPWATENWGPAWIVDFSGRHRPLLLGENVLDHENERNTWPTGAWMGTEEGSI